MLNKNIDVVVTPPTLQQQHWWTHSNNNINEHVATITLMSIEHYNNNIDARCNNNIDEHVMLHYNIDEHDVLQ